MVSKQEKVDYIAEFKKFYKDNQGSQDRLKSFGSEDLSKRVDIREKIRQEWRSPESGVNLNLEEHQEVADSIYESYIVTSARRTLNTLMTYFTREGDNIIASLPSKGLEAMALEINPLGIEGNDKHNLLASSHMSYNAIKKMNEDFVEGKIEQHDYVKRIAGFAVNQTNAMFKEHNEKAEKEGKTELMIDKKTCSSLASIRAKIIGSHVSLARAHGAEIESESKKMFLALAKELAKPTDKKETPYTLDMYARTNLGNNEDVRMQIEQSMAVLKAAEKGKK